MLPQLSQALLCMLAHHDLLPGVALCLPHNLRKGDARAMSGLRDGPGLGFRDQGGAGQYLAVAGFDIHEWPLQGCDGAAEVGSMVSMGVLRVEGRGVDGRAV